MSYKPMNKEERIAAAVKEGVKLAKKYGASRVSIASVAAELEVSPPYLFHIIGTHAEFVKLINKQAKKDGVVLAAAAPTVKEMRAKKAAPPVKKAVAKKATVTVTAKKAVVKKVAAILKKPAVKVPVKKGDKPKLTTTGKFASLPTPNVPFPAVE